MPTLVEKIANACKDVAAVKVEGDNLEFRYLRIVDLAEAIRGNLFREGIIILPDDIEANVEYVQAAASDRWWTRAKVVTEFTITDGVTSLKVRGVGHAQDLDGFAFEKAKTYALKSFLKRLGLIFGDFDDPERRDDDISDLRPDLQKELDEQRPFTPQQVKDYQRALKVHGRTADEESAFMRQIGTPEFYQRRDFLKVMRWALKREENNDSPRMDQEKVSPKA